MAKVTVENQANLILVNGKVFTADPSQPYAEAVAVRGERILAVGTSEEMGALADVNTRRIDLLALHPIHPPGAITREQAVEAYTRGSAFAEFEERDKGTLARGKLADIAVLSQDIFTVPLDALPATQSILTLVGGKIVHDAKAL